VWQWVRDLNRRGHTIIYTTHQMVEAEELCDRVAILHQGRIVALDTPRQLKADHGGGSLEDTFIALTGESLDGR
jgi:ABC-2 type transport system ATP-binding protein